MGPQPVEVYVEHKKEDSSLIPYGGLKLLAVVAAMSTAFAFLTTYVHICVGTAAAMLILWVVHQCTTAGWFNWLRDYYRRNVRAMQLEFSSNGSSLVDTYFPPHQNEEGRPYWGDPSFKICVIVSGWRTVPVLNLLFYFLPGRNRRAWVQTEWGAYVSGYRVSNLTFRQTFIRSADDKVRGSWTGGAAAELEEVRLTDDGGVGVILQINEAVRLVNLAIRTEPVSVESRNWRIAECRGFSDLTLRGAEQALADAVTRATGSDKSA